MCPRAIKVLYTNVTLPNPTPAHSGDRYRSTRDKNSQKESLRLGCGGRSRVLQSGIPYGMLPSPAPTDYCHVYTQYAKLGRAWNTMSREDTGIKWTVEITVCGRPRAQNSKGTCTSQPTLYICNTQTWLTGWRLITFSTCTCSLVPRPSAAFCRMQYGKAGRAWYVSYYIINK